MLTDDGNNSRKTSQSAIINYYNIIIDANTFFFFINLIYLIISIGIDFGLFSTVVQHGMFVVGRLLVVRPCVIQRTYRRATIVLDHGKRVFQLNAVLG